MGRLNPSSSILIPNFWSPIAEWHKIKRICIWFVCDMTQDARRKNSFLCCFIGLTCWLFLCFPLCLRRIVSSLSTILDTQHQQKKKKKNIETNEMKNRRDRRRNHDRQARGRSGRPTGYRTGRNNWNSRPLQVRTWDDLSNSSRDSTEPSLQLFSTSCTKPH